MPRKSIPEIYLALSPRQAASALGISYPRVAAAIAEGSLVVRAMGPKRRIAVFGEAGIQEWFLSWPQAKRKTR